MRCCDFGKVQFPLWKLPPEPLSELFEGETDRAKRHQKYISRINTLLAFAARQSHQERIPGKGVPIVKVRGSYTHTASSILKGGDESTPRFGTLYALDSAEEATQFRLENEMVSTGIEVQLIRELGEMFQDCNEYAKKFKHMKDVVNRELVFHHNVFYVQ